MSDFEIIDLGPEDEADIENDINYWLAQPNDESQKPKQYTGCKSDCGQILKTFYTKKLVKISMLSGTYIGIDYTNWMHLCDLCKQAVMDWYFGEVFVTDQSDRPSINLFQLEIEADNAANDWDSAERDFVKMLDDYQTDNVSLLSYEELYDMKDHCRGLKNDYKDAYSRLQTKIIELGDSCVN